MQTLEEYVENKFRMRYEIWSDSCPRKLGRRIVILQIVASSMFYVAALQVPVGGTEKESSRSKKGFSGSLGETRYI